MKKNYLAPEAQMDLVYFEKGFLTGTYTSNGEDISGTETFDPFVSE